MTKAEVVKMNDTIEELASYMALKADLEAQIDALKAEITATMDEEGLDEYITESGKKATWRATIASRLNTTKLKKDFMDLYKSYCTETTYKRFTVR